MPDFPAQRRERLQWILDVVRENQDAVRGILFWLSLEPKYQQQGCGPLNSLHKSDRDALLQPNGILTDEQIELLK